MTDGARARAAHARVRVQHAARRQGRSTTGCATTRAGSRAGTSPTRRATSRCRRSSTRCRARYDIPQRWYALKAQLLGLDRLADYDRMASVATSDEEFGWSEARELVLDAYASFSPELADVAAAVLRRGVDRRARCARASARARSARTRCRRQHPYLLLNWTARRRDVLTLAHEMGHGLHAYLARGPGRLPPDHAADAGRDRVGVRRDRHVRSAARRDRRSRRRAWRCWPRASRARSRRCSARSR